VPLVVPPVPLLVVGRVGRVAILRLLAHEAPHLIELRLAGLRGKQPRVHRGPPGRAVRPGGRTASPCRGAPSPAARSGGRRTPRPGARGPRRPCPRADALGIRVCPCVRRRGRRRCGTGGFGTAFAPRIGCGRGGCPRRGGRGLGRRGSSSRSVRGRPWWFRAS